MKGISIRNYQHSNLNSRATIDAISILLAGSEHNQWPIQCKAGFDFSQLGLEIWQFFRSDLWKIYLSRLGTLFYDPANELHLDLIGPTTYHFKPTDHPV